MNMTKIETRANDLVIYIILHYKAFNKTIQCVSSIQAHSYYEHIIIVDNASPDGSGDALIEKYDNDKNISIIKSNRNLGYANGFNFGIKYVRDNFDSCFICLLNNDTELLNDDWDKIILDKYKKYNFAVLGPDIINLNGEHGNPRKSRNYSLPSVLFMTLKKMFEYYCMLLFNIDIISIIKKREANDSINSQAQQGELNLSGVELQGSCLILSPCFFLHETGLYTGTFMFFEESILKYICDRDGLSMLYSNELKLLHKEGSSTDSLNLNKRNKRLYELKNGWHSCSSLFKLIINDNRVKSKN